MERRSLNTLIVGDSDLDCNCDKVTLDNMTVVNLGFLPGDIEKFDLIIYEGTRGTKILKSKYTGNGKLVP